MSNMKMVLAVLLAMAGVVIVASQNAPLNCPAQSQFAPCLQYVTKADAAAPPKADPCCGLVNSLTPDCLCHAATSPTGVPGVTVIFEKAISLPKACGRPVPADTTCNESWICVCDEINLCDKQSPGLGTPVPRR